MQTHKYKTDTKNPRYQISGALFSLHSIYSGQAQAPAAQFLLSSRLYCRSRNLTRSTAARGSRTIPPVGNHTPPRRTYSLILAIITLYKPVCKHFFVAICIIFLCIFAQVYIPLHISTPFWCKDWFKFPAVYCTFPVLSLPFPSLRDYIL